METEILLTLLVVAAAAVLFISGAVRVDVAAVFVTLALAWLGLVTPAQALSGFSSSAVIAMLSVMVLGRGLDRTGVTIRIARAIVGFAGIGERRLIAAASIVAGSLSAFMQSVGATAVFLPSLLRVSSLSGVPASRLLLPVGYAATLGGTISMVGAGTLIILNDLLSQQGYAPFGLFAVTPVGVPLLIAGIAFFCFFGDRVLPRREKVRLSPQEELIRTWCPPCVIFYLRVPAGSPLVGMTREAAHMISRYNLHLISLAERGEVVYTPWRYTRFAAGQELGILGHDPDVERFMDDFGLEWVRAGESTANVMADPNVGFAEVIVRPYGEIVGKTLRDLEFRVTYGVEVLILLSGTEEQRQNLADRPLQAGDAMVVLGRWERLRALATNRNFVLATPVEGRAGVRERGAPAAVLCFVAAVLCFVAAVGLTYTGLSIATSLLSGVLAMILLGVVPVGEVYRAIDWRTLTLIAGLLPLGIAMETSGAARFIADQTADLVAGYPTLLILVAVALLATAFSLVISNIAATVILVPLALVMAGSFGLDPRGLALLVGICTSNSFLLPTHPVNALLMGPGNYRPRDYIVPGSVMTVVFILIAVGIVSLLYF
ncbi:transporter, divalent anion:Na+ symporter (DASS) family [Methanoculleus chikugoensis]|jgi:di/tricarboxylate transporter|uniref:Transporter, divalent anion:Na+ symporter (DASS) family n=1 Tax=Methanoculleus chikugoensis TaxID=118126 RepID=A0A1M4MKG9_9EURY|nr:SLC13 family permease [Methanoculleus chikugoensis]SCL75431.1 transporter, divalent anion:Na+ symporter (DASS) family [Methanoculleus chikugoensis]